MGHDMTAIKDYTEYQKFWNDIKNYSKVDEFRKQSEIAYLRRSMGSETIGEVYEFLGWRNAYAGCSGNGSFGIVDIRELKYAKKEIKNSNFDKRDKKHYLEFVNACINYCKIKQKEGVIIHFG